MQLSKLEIKGFKSFGEAVSLTFDKGVTGIVGPNGCGKSNVVDAIRWVLGEQKTRSLRSDKMENILFNGTQNRKAAQVAQVSLTFDNTRSLLPSEFAYVTITRRYHRSGDSEYLINDVKCRLKDIQNLFLDTGIGPDSYAIIELKKVDDILSDKENSRRDLFEKAAGISKYKIRKKESLVRLESVDKDLNRVGDILFELEKNLRSLERQAKQAERYFKLKEKYRNHSLAYAQKALGRFMRTQLDLSQKLQTETQKRDTLTAQLRQIEQELEQEKTKIEHFEQSLAYKQKLLNEHQGKIRNLENEKKIRKEKIFFLNEKIEKIRLQIEQDINQQALIKQKMQQLEAERDSAEKIWQEAQSQRSQLQSVLEIQKQKTLELQSRLKSQEELYRAKLNGINQINQRFEIKKSQLNSAKQELEKAASQNQTLEAELRDYDQALEKCQSDLAEAKQELQAFQEKQSLREDEIKALEQKIQTQREKLAEQQRQKDARQNEYQLTQSFLSNLEGFPQAIQFLQKENRWAENVPLLSDLIVCEEKYRRAIESYLNPWINYYVVNTKEEALEAINLLQNAKKGKANFFILEELSEIMIPKGVAIKTSEQEPNMFFGGLDLSELKNNTDSQPVKALEVISGEKAHESLLYHLLGELYILPDVSFLEEYPNPRHQFVTLSGEVIKRNYQIIGGSVGASEGKRLGGAKNLERLKREIEVLEQAIHTIEEDLKFSLSNLKNLKENKSLKEAYENTTRKVNQINEQFISLRSKKEQLGKVVENNQGRYEEAQEKIYELQEETNELFPKVQEEQTEIEDLRERVDDLRDSYSEENEKLSLQTTQFNEENLKGYQLENRTQNLTQELGFLEKQHEDIAQRLTKQEGEMCNTEGELEGFLENEENYDETLQDLHSQTEGYEKNFRSVEKDFYELRAQRNDKEKALRETQTNRENQEMLLRELEKKQYEINLELTGLRERLAAEFEISVQSIQEAIIEEELQELTETELKEKAAQYKNRLDNIGTVNPMAMEEYQAQEERFNFIDEQKKDLESSKKSLMKTISETEAFARTAFMEAYENIRQNFIKVFRSLFSAEDQADLKLLDPENPLESKIDIVAQPKGKRPLTIDQLSGGEKTLTATSLLFALYLLKPAPFCIFDEVDAPLDDANTDKFNNIIREFSANSQFIVVTHNKRSMEMTDILYGVVMAELGVSSIVPVSFQEAEKVLENKTPS